MEESWPGSLCQEGVAEATMSGSIHVIHQGKQQYTYKQDAVAFFKPKIEKEKSLLPFKKKAPNSN